VPSVIDRAARRLEAIGGVDYTATPSTIAVRPSDSDGFAVTLAMEHARAFVVTYEQWRHTFDRAEDAYDCFEFGLSDSCRLRVTYRGDDAIAWHVEKREYGIWAPSSHTTTRWTWKFWKPRRIVHRQNKLFSTDRP
jgi:hypothetical protein